MLLNNIKSWFICIYKFCIVGMEIVKDRIEPQSLIETEEDILRKGGEDR